MCFAVARSKSPIRPGTEGYAYGWGTDKDYNHNIDAIDLGGMDIVTLPCEDFTNEDLNNGRVDMAEKWEDSKAPIFICSAPRPNVGLCDGDSGGRL